MNIDDCYLLGHIVKAHGNSGEVVIFLDVDDPSEYYKMESVFILNKNELVPFFVLGIHSTNHPQKFLCRLEGVETTETAESLKNFKLYLPLSSLPKLADNQFYYHEIIGFEVMEKSGKKIGVIENVYEMPNEPLMSINHNGKEVLVPIKNPLYDSIDKKSKIIYVNLPEGYLEIYTDEN